MYIDTENATYPLTHCILDTCSAERGGRWVGIHMKTRRRRLSTSTRPRCTRQHWPGDRWMEDDCILPTAYWLQWLILLLIQILILILIRYYCTDSECAHIRYVHTPVPSVKKLRFLLPAPSPYLSSSHSFVFIPSSHFHIPFMFSVVFLSRVCCTVCEMMCSRTRTLTAASSIGRDVLAPGDGDGALVLLDIGVGGHGVLDLLRHRHKGLLDIVGSLGTCLWTCRESVTVNTCTCVCVC